MIGRSRSVSTVEKVLTVGDIAHTWKIIKKLGEGGFGFVYEVEGEKGEKFAMKTKKVEAITRTLKLEVIVLKALKHNGRLAHFCEFYDSGRDYSYNYLVMEYLGKSLGDIKKSMNKDGRPGKFSLGCALSVGIECLEAIQHLHEVGFLHRDIKLANFAISKDDPRRIMFFDFELCRRFIDAQKNIRPSRWAAGFRGTLRYASISVHISREMSPKDDIESWFYQLVELTTGSPPWAREENIDKICQMKETLEMTNWTIL